MTYDPGQQGWPQQPYGQQPGWGQPGGQPGYGGPAAYGGPPGYGGAPGPINPEGGFNFFPALFDFGFTRFATFGLVKILYIIGAVVIVLSWLAYVVILFQLSPVAGILTLVFGAVGALFALAYLRVLLEFLYAVVRMSNDIHSRRSQ